MAAELMLLSSGDEGWRAYPLENVTQAGAVIWSDQVKQYSADEATPISIPDRADWLVDGGVTLPDHGRDMVVRAEVVEDVFAVDEVIADSFVRPFVTDAPQELRLRASQRHGGPSLSIAKVATVASKLQSPHNRSFLRLSAFEGRPILIWFSRGGHQGWVDAKAGEVAAKREADRVRKERAAQAEKEALHDSGTAFINPYSFVPLPDVVHRAAPHGHAGHPDLLIGSIDLTYELITDLVLPSDWAPDRQGNQIVMLPGSGIRGAVRTVHEVVAGGCLRVIDPDYVPIHRETTSDVKVQNNTLAIVTSVDTNEHVTEITLAEQPVWIPYASFAGRPGLRSGLRFDLAAPASRPNPKHGGRLESTGLVTISPNPEGSWVLHLSDTGTRGRHPYWVPVAKLTERVVTVTPHMRRLFEDASLRAEGVDGHLAQSAPDWGSPTWPGVPVVSQRDGDIGERRKIDGRLGRGDSVWWVPDEQRIKMAVMWRKAGRGAVKDRIGETLQPCANPALLCPTCRVFGAAGPTEGPGSNSRGDGSHRAYAGHVRFLPGASETAVQVRSAELAPLREPRPGSGGFYLENTAPPEMLRGKMGEPKSHWGSALDRPKPRRIAGRKFYWHGQQAFAPNTGTTTPRQYQRKDEIDDPPRWLVPAGTRFVTRVTFDGLDEEQLVLLVCALDPQELTRVPGAPLPHGCLALHLGGGKPLGFGTVVCRDKKINAQRAADRYAGGVALANQDTLASSALEVIDPQEPWFPALVHVLDTAFVDADRIHYPFDPEATSFTPGPTPAAFLESFRFFSHYNGGYERTLPGTPQTKYLYPMVPLPRAEDSAASQYVAPSPEEKR